MRAPELPYEPPEPGAYDPGIALIGCGGITESHLSAYRDAGWTVVAFCDLEAERARERRDEFYPGADVHTDHEAVLARDDVAVVDVATHPEARPPLIRDAVDAGKHVLSQKPFVLDLAVGRDLIERAEDAGVKLAVNQNARWAPHFSYLREAVAAEVVGAVTGVHCAVRWDHDWIEGTPFEEIDHAILYDFAIHWFDFLATVTPGREPERVHATTARSPTQASRPPLLGQALVEYDGLQASLVFDGNTRHGTEDRTTVVGTQGTLVSEGPDLNDQTVALRRGGEVASPGLEGRWFPDGFRGTMGELLCAVGEDREPRNSGRNNLRSLALCFAAVAAAETGEPTVPGEVDRLPTAGT